MPPRPRARGAVEGLAQPRPAAGLRPPLAALGGGSGWRALALPAAECCSRPTRLSLPTPAAARERPAPRPPPRPPPTQARPRPQRARVRRACAVARMQQGGRRRRGGPGHAPVWPPNGKRAREGRGAGKGRRATARRPPWGPGGRAPTPIPPPAFGLAHVMDAHGQLVPAYVVAGACGGWGRG